MPDRGQRGRAQVDRRERGDARVVGGIEDADENARQGSKDYEKWLRREQELRQRLATLIGAPSRDEIDLLKSTSEGLSVIAIGYYGVGLVGYALKGAEGAGYPVDATIGMAVSVPFVVGLTWLLLRRIKRRVTGAS